MHRRLLPAALAVIALAGPGARPARADLLVSSPGNPLGPPTDKVLRYDDRTGAFLGVFIDGFSGGGPLGPISGLALGPGGLVYAAKTVSTIGEAGAVERRDPATGAFLGYFVPQGSGGLARPGTLAFGPDGDLYVRKGTGAGLPNDSILRYDGRTGAFLGTFIGPIGHEINDFVFGPDRNVNVNSAGGNVLRYDGTTGQPLGLFAGGIGGDFQGRVFGPDGNLYVSDDLGSAVRWFDGTTGALLGNFVAPKAGGLFNPTNLVFGPDGSLYVSSRDDNSVKRYDGATGAYLGDFVPPGGGGLSGPTALLFTAAAVPKPPALPLAALAALASLAYGWGRKRWGSAGAGPAAPGDRSDTAGPAFRRCRPRADQEANW
jgi:DNA-binding beta-propeller fold protein YncE